MSAIATWLVRAHYPLRSFGFDYTDKLAQVPGTQLDVVDLNRQPLPYADHRFVLVTCIETIEHLENYRRRAEREECLDCSSDELAGSITGGER